jgi:hypothetical protein
LEENRNQLNRQKASKAKIAQLIGGNGNKNSPMDVDVQLVTFGKENQEELKVTAAISKIKRICILYRMAPLSGKPSWTGFENRETRKSTTTC